MKISVVGSSVRSTWDVSELVCSFPISTHMQFRAARSLWMKFFPLRYSIPLAISVMNFTSIWEGRYYTKETEIIQIFKTSMIHDSSVNDLFLFLCSCFDREMEPETFPDSALTTHNIRNHRPVGFKNTSSVQHVPVPDVCALEELHLWLQRSFTTLTMRMCI